MEFKLHAPFKPTGDQPEAIEKLAQGVKMGLDEQVLLGVTGSGKTFTMASVIEKVQRPTLVLAHNKTLAAQLCAEFKEFFPENAVEYFVSYYDYYQPEAYIPHTDTYIAKDASTNEEIDRLRLSATCALLERRDVIVVSSVSCIYGLGEPEDFEKLMISLRPGMTMERDFLLKRLIEIRYERNDVAFERNRFRVRGDTVELYPAYYRDKAVRVEFFGDEIDRISEFNPVNGQVARTLQHIAIYPASHYVTTKDKLERAIVEIDKELDEREAQFLAEGKAVGVSRGAADGLDEARFAAEEAFLIRVQNRDHRDLGDVKALAQEVDADEHVELAEAQAADELHALDGLDVRVHVAHADADAGQILRQVLGHLFRQRGDEHALIARRAGVDLADEIIDLVFDGAHLDLRVE